MTDREILDGYAQKKSKLTADSDTIPQILYQEYGVNRGLRDLRGKGVLTGLTRISRICAFKQVNGKNIPIDGRLFYRGYPIEHLVDTYGKTAFGFEKTAYLLLFGEKPTEPEAKEFIDILNTARVLPDDFTRDVIMKAVGKDIMNSMTKSILTLASYDSDASDISLPNCIRQAIRMISIFPMLAVYAYHAYHHYQEMGSMYLHRPDPNRSTAENFLMMLRPDQSYTELEAQVPAVALMLHMEHGGGNNSTFTTRVVTSSGTDTYSAIAAAMSSLKGPRHGGANIKVMEMMDDIKAHVSDTRDEEAISDYLTRILHKDAFDRQGLIYGIGHAVYSLSDPRERIFKEYVRQLSKEKGREDDMAFYEYIEKAAPELIAKERKIFKGVSPNVDFYSGFVYDMLGIPRELFTPLFAIARIVGWNAHRLEELTGMNKIIRPAYMSVMEERPY